MALIEPVEYWTEQVGYLTTNMRRSIRRAVDGLLAKGWIIRQGSTISKPAQRGRLHTGWRKLSCSVCAGTGRRLSGRVCASCQGSGYQPRKPTRQSRPGHVDQWRIDLTNDGPTKEWATEHGIVMPTYDRRGHGKDLLGISENSSDPAMDWAIEAPEDDIDDDIAAATYGEVA